MAQVSCPAFPLPGHVTLFDASTAHGAGTAYPLKFTRDQLFKLWWNIKTISMNGVNASNFHASSETDLVCGSGFLWEEILLNRENSRLFTINTGNTVYVSDDEFYPNIYYLHDIVRASGPNLGCSSIKSEWTSPIPSGTITIWDVGSFPIYTASADPTNESFTASIAETWPYNL